MLYRLRIDAPSPVRPPDKLLKELKLFFASNAVTINAGTPREELAFYSMELCYHDESLAKPCELLEELNSP